MMIPAEQALAVAVLAARCAGEHVMGQLDRRHDVNRADKFDVKHKLDVEAQEVAMGVIRAAYPEHAVLGEESADSPLPDSDYLWVVDPIDGTVNFFHGTPWWCCSVAFQYRGETIAGAVFAPELGRCFTATADGPALCNGKPIHVSDLTDPQLATFATGSGGFFKGQFTTTFIEAIGKRVQRIRINGAAALDLCMVAAGAIDGYFEAGIYLWDIAAGGLIVRQAGGCAEALVDHGGYKLGYLAGPPGLFSLYREALAPLMVPSRD